MLFLTSHLSNIPLLGALVLTGMIVILVKKNDKPLKKYMWQKVFFILLIFVITLATLAIYNKRHFSRLSLSPSGSVFFFARLIDTGLIGPYLSENCDRKDYLICRYRDSIPRSSQEFLWHTEGIFYQMGGWYKYGDEAAGINKGILTTPKYYKTLLWHFTKATLKQLVTCSVGGDFYNFTDGSWKPVYDKCLENFPRNEMRRDFLNTRQTKETLSFGLLNYVFTVALILSVFVLLYFLLRRQLKETATEFIIIVLSAVVSNAFICANLSNVLSRYRRA
ncbi:MAG: hypothetical protein BWY70_00246 [Bacteroidetes bacterium ADurb.Bin408]|nr:MAG: hypothetical protein BWY70_00246 [Bacteroidetes bacterium ADurb.Bin408]